MGRLVDLAECGFGSGYAASPARPHRVLALSPWNIETATLTFGALENWCPPEGIVAGGCIRDLLVNDKFPNLRPQMPADIDIFYPSGFQPDAKIFKRVEPGVKVGSYAGLPMVDNVFRAKIGGQLGVQVDWVETCIPASNFGWGVIVDGFDFDINQAAWPNWSPKPTCTPDMMRALESGNVRPLPQHPSLDQRNKLWKRFERLSAKFSGALSLIPPRTPEWQAT